MYASILLCSSLVLACNKVLSKGKGSGSYYYDVSGRDCEIKVSEIDGYTSCESYTPGKNQMTLQERRNDNIVAIEVEMLNEPGGRKRYCGKRVRVRKSGKLIKRKFFVWDGCAGCRELKRLDFSLTGLLQIENDTCFLGIVPDLTWEITSEQVMEFHP